LGSPRVPVRVERACLRAIKWARSASTGTLGEIVRRAAAGAAGRMGGLLAGERGQERLAVPGEFGLAHARDGAELFEGGRAARGDLTQGRVVEDDVGGNALFLRLRRAPGSQRLEDGDRLWGEVGKGGAVCLRAAGLGRDADGLAPQHDAA